MKIGFAGAGNMARALARGWGEPVLCTDGGSGRAAALVAELGGEALGSNDELVERSDVLLLCHKPTQLESVAKQAAGAKVVVSVLGGVSLERLQAAYPGAEVARAMPNTAVEVRQGVTCLCFGEGARDATATWVRERFAALGAVFELPERTMAAATATAGVAPAYTALVAEAQIDAAVKAGLSPALAAEIVTASLGGSAALIAARDYDTLAVRREVTSPGGVTARGLEALERGGLRVAFADATAAVLEAMR